MKYVLSDLQKNVFRECTSLKKPFILCQLTEKSQTKEIYVILCIVELYVYIYLCIRNKHMSVSFLESDPFVSWLLTTS